MTRSEFIDLMNVCGFRRAVEELSYGCDEIASEDCLADVAIDLLSRGYYGDVAEICGVLHRGGDWYRVDFSTNAEPTSIETMDDVEDLFEEEE